MTCPRCGSEATGSFCSSCGTALADAVCSNCSTPLSTGARFCHRCGTPVGASPVANRGIAPAIPWAVAGIALVALIALVVGQRFGERTSATTAEAPAEGQTAPAMPRAPDISQMTPLERAERLYDRIMRETEAGNTENARTFLPMAVAAYESLGALNLDQRYDLGRIGVVAGDTALAHAQADTILAKKPTHLLGLMLAAQVARLEKKDAKAKDFDARLVANEAKERAGNLPEYAQHAAEIQAAIAAATPK
jgi:hypothetical protein